MASTTNPVNLNADSNPTPFLSSSPETGFVPRKEFTSSSIRQASSFALLSFSSNNVIRVTNFDRSVFNELNARLHSVIGLRAFRENPEHKLGEIILLGKPWSNARSLSTEIVIIQIFTIVLGFGYTFVSQIDYGREPSDRVTLVFSKAGPRTALDPEEKPFLSSSRIIPFGLTFTSATSLRVVCSPLTGTPAILQSIRGAWPKGVKSEKKLGEHCYEFKFKGYSWFQEDTFADDAPRHILTILSSLDKYSWDLITSLSLSSSRSRTKDFWIFTSRPDASSDQIIRPVSLINLGTPLKPSDFEPIEDGFGNASPGSEGSNTAAHSTEDLTMGERRANGPSYHKSTGSNSSLEANQIRRGHLRVSSDLTGLATSREPTHRMLHTMPRSQPPQPILTSQSPILRSTSPTPTSETSPAVGQPPTHSLISLPEDAEDGRPHSAVNPYPEQMVNHAPRSGDHDIVFPSSALADPPISPIPPLLVPNAFRTDSEPEGLRSSMVSHFSEKSVEIPITWVPLDENGERESQVLNPSSEDEPRRAPPSAFPRHTIGSVASALTEVSDGNDPIPPGGWVNTPKADVQDPMSNDENLCYTDSNPLNGTLQRDPELLKEPTTNPVLHSSPFIVQPGLQDDDHFDRTRRKSETGVVGTVSQTPQEPLPTDTAAIISKDDDTVKATTGSWVVVSHRESPTGHTLDNELPSPDAENLPKAVKLPINVTTITSPDINAAAIDQTQTTKESPTRRRSVMGRLLGQSPRKGDDDLQTPAPGEEKRNRLKSRKLLSGRSRK